MEVLKDNKSMFGVNFDENKKALNKISTITSKILKNELAGYITKFIKNELRNEREKTEFAENEEQISEDIEPTKDESKSEVIVEEPTKDESKSEVIVEEPTKDESKSEVIVEKSSATTELQD
jgi:small subunit ribosomal protein S17e